MTRGAKQGANSDSSRATPGYSQALSTQLNPYRATPGDVPRSFEGAF